MPIIQPARLAINQRARQQVPTARGRVLELGGCAHVEVLETSDRYLEIAVGEVLGGVLRLACVGSGPLEVGDEIFFDFRPGDAQRCPERDACWATCAGAPPECSTRCVNETAEECADDLARSHQTGRFLAVSVMGAQASFRFAGETRAASVEELLEPSCWQEHQRIIDDYQSALESMPPVSMNGASSQAVMPAPQPAEPDPTPREPDARDAGARARGVSRRPDPGGDGVVRARLGERLWFNEDVPNASAASGRYGAQVACTAPGHSSRCVVVFDQHATC